MTARSFQKEGTDGLLVTVCTQGQAEGGGGNHAALVTSHSGCRWSAGGGLIGGGSPGWLVRMGEDSVSSVFAWHECAGRCGENGERGATAGGTGVWGLGQLCQANQSRACLCNSGPGTGRGEMCLSLWWKKPLLPDQEGRCVLDPRNLALTYVIPDRGFTPEEK